MTNRKKREAGRSANRKSNVEHPNSNQYRNQWIYYANYIRCDNVKQEGNTHNRCSRRRRNSDERRPYRNNEGPYCNRGQSPSPSLEEVNQEGENRQDRVNDCMET